MVISIGQCHLLGSQQTATVTAGMAYGKQEMETENGKRKSTVSWL